MNKKAINPEIKDVDFKNLHPEDEKIINEILKSVATVLLDDLHRMPDKDVPNFYCGEDSYSANQLIDAVKNLNGVGLEQIKMRLDTWIMVNTLDVEKQKKSWKYKISNFLDALPGIR